MLFRNNFNHEYIFMKTRSTRTTSSLDSSAKLSSFSLILDLDGNHQFYSELRDGFWGVNLTRFCLWGRSNLFHFKCRSHFVFSPASISCEMAPFSAGIKASRHFITFLHFLHQSRSHLSLSLLLSFSSQSDPTCLVEWFSLSTLSKRTNYVYVARIKITRPVENVNKLGLKCTWTVTDYREV